MGRDFRLELKIASLNSMQPQQKQPDFDKVKQSELVFIELCQQPGGTRGGPLL